MLQVWTKVCRGGIVGLAALLLLAQCTPDTLEDFTTGTVVDGANAPDTKGNDSGDDGSGTPDIKPPTCTPGVKECGAHYNPCRVYVCTAEGKCLEELLKDGLECDDGKLCVADQKCNGGKCEGGTEKDCDDDDKCTVDSCKEDTGGCLHEPAKDGTGCDPAQPLCWGSGQCFAGKCVGKTPTCKCHPDWELDDDPETPKCPKWVLDNDKCKGAMYCKKNATGAFYHCAVNPATEVECTDKNDGICRKNTCNKETAVCEMINFDDGTACEDGDMCTKSETCQDGQCTITNMEESLLCKCTPKYLEKCKNELGVNPCDGILYCANYPGNAISDPTCAQASKVECSTASDTTCLKNACNTKNGQCQMTKVLPAVAGKDVNCDDGDGCFPNDICKDGLCEPGPLNICPCTKDADCADKDDGNVCNGVLFCDLAGGNVCKLNPASVVNCASVNDNLCVKNFCFPTTGKCALIPTTNLKTETLTKILPSKKKISVVKQTPYPYSVQEFVGCDDNNDCTVNDKCVGATCQAGDTNTCGCAKDSDCIAIDDGDFCNGVLFCDKLKGKCEPNPSSVVTCTKTDNTFCLANLCDPKKGECAMTPTKDGTICDDGNACTANEACHKGQCAHKDVTQLCKCAKNSDCASEEDGNKCNGVLYCDKNTGSCLVNPATVIKCGSANDTQCTKNLCEAKTGQCKLTPVNENLVCNDGDPCTPSPTCKQGKCFSETNICQCKSNADCAAYEDGNSCTGTMFCDKANGMCKTNPASVVSCLKTKDTACSKNLCDPKDGECKMSPVADNVVLCEDGSPCTQFDFCKGGKCSPGTNTCQCEKDDDCKVIDDGDLCDGTLFCDKSDPKAFRCVLKPNSTVVCPPDAPKSCVVEACNTSNGKCEPKDKGNCDDKDPCTLDTCILADPKKGECKHTPAPDGANADVGKICIGGKVVTIPKDVAFVPAGDLWMGCNPAIEKCATFPDETQHKVKLSAFWVDLYEVRVSRYKACFNSGKCTKPKKTDPGCNYDVAGQESHPMNCLSHAEAAAFCLWDGGKRLPTEAEWEKAARGGCEVYGDDAACKSKVRTYVWGESPSPNCTQAVMKDDKGVDGCGDNKTASVASLGQTDVSAYGAFDMAGNVREFVVDFFDAKFYEQPGATQDDAKNTKATSDIVIRGGGWKSVAAELRAAHRGKAALASDGAVDIGFRCVQTYN